MPVANGATPAPLVRAPLGAPPPDIRGTGLWQSYTVGACDAAVLAGTWSVSGRDRAKALRLHRAAQPSGY